MIIKKSTMFCNLVSLLLRVAARPVKHGILLYLEKKYFPKCSINVCHTNSGNIKASIAVRGSGLDSGWARPNPQSYSGEAILVWRWMCAVRVRGGGVWCASTNWAFTQGCGDLSDPL